MNGDVLDPSMTYILQINNVNTPNTDTSSMYFEITSYYDANVYLGKIIC